MRRSVALIVLLAVIAGCGSGGSTKKPPAVPPPAAAKPSGARLPRPAGIVLHGPRARREVALTFDADMTRGMLAALRAHRVSGWYDAALFATLRATRTPATIFLTGLWTQQYPQIVRALARDPRFELENHSLDHAGFETPCFGLPTVATLAGKRFEIGRARAIIERVTGVRPRYFRFPGGCHTAADVRLVRSFGERPVQWDVVSGDAFEHDPQRIVRAVLDGVRPGSIIVAHCIGAPNTPATARAIRTIIPALRARGYQFVTVAQLLQRRTP
jgi:peptidoglycan/xylan/chitin deacetylase (PgdA/CDA1 family)